MLQAIAFLPVILLQGLWVAVRVERLPPAAGPTKGLKGEGERLRVLMLGDSSAAGMGAETQDQALMGQLAHALSQDFEVEWSLVAKGGVTSKQSLAMLRASQEARCDVAVICLGVNDAKNAISARQWQSNYRAILSELHARGAKHIVACGIPDIGQFPLLPWPLQPALGARAGYFDRLLQRLVDEHQHAQHVPSVFEMDPAKMARDGFHPGPEIYRFWGQGLAEVIRARRRP